jgi:WD40 repeat protein
MITNLLISNPVTGIQFSRNGKYLLSYSQDSIGRLWDIGSSKVLQEYTGASQSVSCFSNSKNRMERVP